MRSPRAAVGHARRGTRADSVDPARARRACRIRHRGCFQCRQRVGVRARARPHVHQVLVDRCRRLIASWARASEPALATTSVPTAGWLIIDSTIRGKSSRIRKPVRSARIGRPAEVLDNVVQLRARFRQRRQPEPSRAEHVRCQRADATRMGHHGDARLGGGLLCANNCEISRSSS